MRTEEGWVEDDVVVAESSLLRVERDTGYGSVPGLEDKELADPAELERQVMLAEWGPILAIPIRWDYPAQCRGERRAGLGRFRHGGLLQATATVQPGIAFGKGASGGFEERLDHAEYRRGAADGRRSG